MRKLLFTLVVFSAAWGQYRLEPAAGPPSELAPPIAGELQAAGHKITGPDGKVWCEVWFVKQAPKGPLSTETDVTWKTVPIGSVLGAIRWPNGGSDRRGQAIKPGVYVLRYGNFPINGDHQGVAPQRDFLVMSLPAEDKTLDPVKVFDNLMNLSRKVSTTQHPAVLSMWLVESGYQAGFAKAGEQDWALQTEVGDAKIALILVGKTE